tara:strand:+ start:756 stop:935 length:180 start_codon:yes stop_codon:yes gene_type:complete
MQVPNPLIFVDFLGFLRSEPSGVINLQLDASSSLPIIRPKPSRDMENCPTTIQKALSKR